MKNCISYILYVEIVGLKSNIEIMNTKTIEDFISEESKNFADANTPEELHYYRMV